MIRYDHRLVGAFQQSHHHIISIFHFRAAKLQNLQSLLVVRFRDLAG
ncbi:hypothetical protein [Nostoc sp.]